MTTPQSLPSPARSADRRERAQAIRDGALVRESLGQGAQHEMVDGEHTITWRGERYRGATVEEVIRAAREGA